MYSKQNNCHWPAAKNTNLVGPTAGVDISRRTEVFALKCPRTPDPPTRCPSSQHSVNHNCRIARHSRLNCVIRPGMSHLATVSNQQLTLNLCSKVTASGKVKTDFFLVREERNVLSADPGGRTVQGVVLRPLTCWDCGFESRSGHACVSVVGIVWCQVEVSVTGWSLVQRSPTDCGASCVI